VVHGDEPGRAEKERKRRKRLRQELVDEGIQLLPTDPDGRVRFEHDREPYPDPDKLFDVLVDELAYARRPPVHETRRSSYGAVVVADYDDFTGLTDYWIRPVPRSGLRFGDSGLHPLTDHRDLAAVRAYANGRTTFLVRSPAGPEALLQLPVGDELELGRLAEEAPGVFVIQRTPAGAVKVFTPGRLYVFEHDEWRVKPYAATRLPTLWRISDRISDRRGHRVARLLLDFCVHLLSARHVGATLVWLLSSTWDTVKTRAPLAGPGQPPAVQLRLNERGFEEAFATLLAGIDGACVLERNGKLVRVKVKLDASERAGGCVAAEGGTRHTSAKRFSFDEPRAIVFVVSQDGPVTVYSDGIAVLRLHAGEPDGDLPSIPDAPVATGPTSVLGAATCTHCGKRLATETLQMPGQPATDLRAPCPECGAADAITGRGHSVHSRPMKPWERQPRPVLPRHSAPQRAPRRSADE
jgi:DisA bacterial checkpoint controller nucleotide-binding